MVRRRFGIRHEQGGLSGRGDFPHGASRARDDEIDSRERGAEVVREREEDVVRARRPVQGLKVPLTGDVQNGWPCVCPGLERRLVQPARAQASSEDQHRPSVLGKPKGLASFIPIDWLRAGRDGPTHNSVLRSLDPLDRKGQEDLPRDRGSESVRQAQVRIGLGERRWDAEKAGREHHRACDIPAASENDIRSSPSENPRAGHRRLCREAEGSNQAKTGPPREALDMELVELEAGLRDQPALNSLRACERHADAACDQRFRDGDRRQDVPGCSSGGDQALERLLRLHGSARC